MNELELKMQGKIDRLTDMTFKLDPRIGEGYFTAKYFLKVNDKYRLITPIEAERLQDFPDNWTAKKKLADGSIVEVYDKMRMFFMGNALVTEIVKEIANFIRKIEK